jgi:acyl-homoserine-lactone acylase
MQVNSKGIQMFKVAIASISASFVVMISGCAMFSPTGEKIIAEIRTTSYGIPHIQSDSETGIGYGYGYVLAKDHGCNLNEMLMTARGERSKYFGPNGKSASGQDNLSSDVFQKWIGSEERVAAFWKAQPPEVKQVFEGAAKGVSRYLRDHTPEQRSPQCAKGPWLNSVSAGDLVRHHLTGAVGLSLSSKDIATAVATARPPSITSSAAELDMDLRKIASVLPELPEDRASNAVAFGREHTRNGTGMLYGNPHLFWQGSTRLHIVHLKLPGKYDVLGSTLPGYVFPFVGFNQNVAWTGTISSIQRFNYFALKLNPLDPTQYEVDGKFENMKSVRIKVDSLTESGASSSSEHTVWETRYGPVLAMQGPFAWTKSRAFAIRDVNIDNFRVLQQYRDISMVKSTEDLKSSMTRILGSYVLQVTSADDQGKTLFSNITPAPNLSDSQLEACVVPEFKPLMAAMGTYPRKGPGIPVLDGSRSSCNWQVAPNSSFPGLVPAANMPFLQRTDFVHNSNDSSWYTQPKQPLVGFPQVVSRSDISLGWRARMNLTQINERFAAKDGMNVDGKVDPLSWIELAMRHRVLTAERHLDEIISVCSQNADLQNACEILKNWDRRAELNSSGYLLFEKIWLGIAALGDNAWTPYDSKDPLSSNMRLRLSDNAVRDQIIKVFLGILKTFEQQKMPLNAQLKDYQFVMQGTLRIPIFGGPEGTGIYNRYDAIPYTAAGAKPGERRAIGGGTHIQSVEFGPEGPRNWSFLAQSQSADPRSPHVDDLTQLLVKKIPVSFPYREDEISRDANLRTLKISE